MVNIIRVTALCFRNIIMSVGILLFLTNQMVMADTVINFHGVVKAGTCDVDTSSVNKTVPLGDVGTINFGNPGDVSSAQPFSLILDCPDGGPNNATITFNGTAASDPTVLALDSGMTASGVGVRINNASDGQKINLGTASATIPLTTGENELNFTAQYVALVNRANIMPGTADATAQFTIIYQ